MCVVGFDSKSHVNFDSIRLFKGTHTTLGVQQPQALNTAEPIPPTNGIQPQAQNPAEDHVDAVVPLKRPSRC